MTMTHEQWREFTRRVPAGTRVRCISAKAWYQTWREDGDPRDYPCFGGPHGEEYEGVLWPYTEYRGPEKCNDQETIVVDVHPFNNFDRNNRGLIHPRYNEIQYFIDDRWQSYAEIML